MKAMGKVDGAIVGAGTVLTSNDVMLAPGAWRTIHRDARAFRVSRGGGAAK